MKTSKRAKVEAAGWAVGSAKDFLGLSPEEAAFVEMKVALSQSVRQWRTRKKLTQGELAQRLRSRLTHPASGRTER